MKFISLPQLPNFNGIFNLAHILSVFKLNTLTSLLAKPLNIKLAVPFVLVSAVLYIVLNYLLLPLIKKIFMKKNDKSKESSFPKKRYEKLESSSMCRSSKSSKPLKCSISSRSSCSSCSECSACSLSNSSSSTEITKNKKCDKSVKLTKKQIKNTLQKFKIN